MFSRWLWPLVLEWLLNLIRANLLEDTRSLSLFPVIFPKQAILVEDCSLSICFEDILISTHNSYLVQSTLINNLEFDVIKKALKGSVKPGECVNFKKDWRNSGLFLCYIKYKVLYLHCNFIKYKSWNYIV